MSPGLLLSSRLSLFTKPAGHRAQPGHSCIQWVPVPVHKHLTKASNCCGFALCMWTGWNCEINDTDRYLPTNIAVHTAQHSAANSHRDIWKVSHFLHFKQFSSVSPVCFFMKCKHFTEVSHPSLAFRRVQRLSCHLCENRQQRTEAEATTSLTPAAKFSLGGCAERDPPGTHSAGRVEVSEDPCAQDGSPCLLTRACKCPAGDRRCPLEAGFSGAQDTGSELY